MEEKMKDEMRDSERVMEMFQVTFLFVLQIYSVFWSIEQNYGG